MKIGIIIPCFNEEQYIGNLLKSLESAIANSKKPENLRIYICDNGSTDSTLNVINSFHQSLPLTVLEEPEKGDGLAMRLAADEAFQTADWIISIDADCTVSGNYIYLWENAISNAREPMLTGYFKFPDAFAKDFPNADYLLKQAIGFNNIIKDIFGIINICGANHAVRKDFYYQTGGYSQPFIVEDSIRKLIAGNDWDLGTKARILKQQIGYVDVYNETSDRRACIDVKGFITGAAYEGVFHSIREREIGPDLETNEMSEILFQNKLRTVKHYAMKPILADYSLLEKTIVGKVLGEQVIFEIQNWLMSNKIKDIYKDRNGFIYGSLEEFHKEFGLKVYNKIIEVFEK